MPLPWYHTQPNTRSPIAKVISQCNREIPPAFATGQIVPCSTCSVGQPKPEIFRFQLAAALVIRRSYFVISIYIILYNYCFVNPEMSYRLRKKLWLTQIRRLCICIAQQGFQQYLIFRMSHWMSHLLVKFQIMKIPNSNTAEQISDARMSLYFVPSFVLPSTRYLYSRRQMSYALKTFYVDNFHYEFI